jgi:uncharacterized tellurite resistance protein B-like protein
MTFSGKEMAALLRAAKMMALADGTMTSDEKDVMIADLKCFGVQIDTLQSVVIEKQANEMDGAEVIKTLSNLNLEQKKYACGYLAAVMTADGDIAKKETKDFQRYHIRKILRSNLRRLGVYTRFCQRTVAETIWHHLAERLWCGAVGSRHSGSRRCTILPFGNTTRPHQTYMQDNTHRRRQICVDRQIYGTQS